MGRPLIVAFTPRGRDLARRLAEPLGFDIAAPDESPREAATAAFGEGRPVVGICAAGILVRLLAPHLSDKRSEPPVVAVAEDGSATVPLLGGHHGANDLAHRIAASTGGLAAVTTASDLAFGIALDEPPAGYALVNPEDVKPFAMALLAGEGARIEGDAPWLAALPQGDGLGITVSPRRLAGGPHHLVYAPRVLALGVGCERGTPAEDVIALAEAVLERHDLASAAVAGVFSLDLKADEPAVHALATHFGVPARFFPAGALDAETPRLANPSEAVRREVGVAGVAEAAALAAAGPGGRLVVEKVKGTRATLAVAEATQPIVPLPGRPRGHLVVVGIGPGSPEWMAPAARKALSEASDWVGYGLYLDLIAHDRRGQIEHRFALGEEEARVRHALALAGEGRNVALVSSGDAGIYAMASLVFEMLASPGVEAAAARVSVEVIPGISAFQAAAARAGALIGHDFAAISLSDLLTPWDVIERRVKAAAVGDFVVAFYNPRSARRADQLGKAMAILSAYRPPATPVVVASNLGRPEEHIAVVELSSLEPAAVDMLSIVLVGSSRSRTFRRGDGRLYAFTPRGYATKPGSAL